MSGYFVFNGFSSREFGLRVGSVNPYAASGRTVQTYYVPGRIGAVYPAVDYSQIPNEIREYTAALYLRNMPNEVAMNMMTLLRQNLMDVDGYAILTDSYDPWVYRRAFFTGDFVPTRKGAGQNFEIPIRFSCDPRRFIAGDYDFTVYGQAGGVVYETPTVVNGFIIKDPAKPLIQIDTAGDAADVVFRDADTNALIGTLSLAGLGVETQFLFDTETLQAWFPDTGDSANLLVSDVTGEIRLGPGATKISFNTSTLALTFTPRWWVR